MNLLLSSINQRHQSCDELKKRLWGNTTVPHKHTVHVKGGVEKVLVVAGQDGDIGALSAEHRDLSVPAAHVADAVLHSDDTGLSSDVEEGLEVLGDLVDDLVAVLRSTRLVAESQPSVRRVQKTSLGTSLLGALGLESSNFSALACDTGDDGDLVVDGLDKGFDGVYLLLLGEEGSFSGVSEHDQALDAVDASKPGAQTLDGVVVDLAIFGEGCDRGGDKAFEIERHDDWWMDVVWEMVECVRNSLRASASSLEWRTWRSDDIRAE
ncbi:hypothetical protein HG530_001576 [Fusarium avenaceum]|nr:hypothetical protein HG530_001576 [Fusarium avenaceum]